SSRRRHTSFSRDWSSDVCSSDLTKHTRPLLSPVQPNFPFQGAAATAPVRSSKRQIYPPRCLLPGTMQPRSGQERLASIQSDLRYCLRHPLLPLLSTPVRLIIP